MEFLLNEICFGGLRQKTPNPPYVAISPSRSREVKITLDYNRGQDLESQCVRVETISNHVLIARNSSQKSEKFHHSSRRKRPLQDATNQLSLFAKPKTKRDEENNDMEEPNENNPGVRLK